MRIVVALGGNALLKRGEPMTHDVQRANIQVAAQALAHGNGPQVGLLALQASAYKVAAAVQFVERTGKRAAIGSLADIEQIVAGTAGTNVATAKD